MSVVRIKREASPRALAENMDRTIEQPDRPGWVKYAPGGAIGLAALSLWWLAPTGSSQRVTTDRLVVSEVRDGVFDDFLPLRGRVTPLVTVYLDAVEGGRVEQVLVEDGSTVAKGQLLAVLSNAELQLSTLARETEVAEQLNNLRTTELNLARTRLNDERDIIQAEADASKARRQYDLQAPLAARGFVTARAFGDTRDDYGYQIKRVRVLRDAQRTDERMQSSQLRQLRATASALQSALTFAHANLDTLSLRAPVAGQLTAFSIQVGQSANRGERLGQIDSPGRNKLTAGVDEFYLGRVRPGQIASVAHDGKIYRMKLAKLYPQVKNGTFEIDLVFVGDEPKGIQRGQSLQTNLTLGDPAPARLLPNGSFYTDTGGAWVFVVAPDGRSAVRRQVRLGRRNADFIEILDGLDAGEKVVTSPYSGMTDKDRLDLTPP